MHMKLFANRVEAGKKLAAALERVSDNAIVLAVPRGGVVVGFEVAKPFRVPLDVIITKKIGAPGNSELAIGAIAEDGTTILDNKLVKLLNISEEYIKDEIERQRLEIGQRLKRYRGDLPPPKIVNREVILVDDGVATGATLKATLALLKHKGAKPVIVAVPVGPPSTIRELEQKADRVICLFTPEPFYAIGEFYEDFNQTSHEEVTKLLQISRRDMRAKKVNR